MENTYNFAMVYLGKACGNQMEEQRHRTFSNLILTGKLSEAIQFVCDREKGGVLQKYELARDCMRTINDTIISILEGQYTSKKILSCAKLERSEETPIFIPIDMKRKLYNL